MSKTGLITGAASGLGYEFSNLLARDHYDLVLVDINESNLLKTKQKIEEKYNIGVETIICDLGKPETASLIYQQIKHRNIDILINNAGFGLFGFFAETNPETEESMINVHILTMTQLTKLIIKGMIRKGSGKILNISSLGAFVPGPLMSVYYATKAFILSFSEALANEVKGTGVTVTVLCPGVTRTNFQNTTAFHSNTKASKMKRFTHDADKVASYGYNAMKAGKSSAVPGILNKFIVLLSRLLPRRINAQMVRKIQMKIRC